MNHDLGRSQARGDIVLEQPNAAIMRSASSARREAGHRLGSGRLVELPQHLRPTIQSASSSGLVVRRAAVAAILAMAHDIDMVVTAMISRSLGGSGTTVTPVPCAPPGMRSGLSPAASERRWARRGSGGARREQKQLQDLDRCCSPTERSATSASGSTISPYVARQPGSSAAGRARPPASQRPPSAPRPVSAP